ncbi:MAG TPA: outer membrane protein assembly factor BamB [Gammaproteobacteria bacterium]|nr:outer membrane protein assembly factor BamB [Gammaproteobacteria bacterium]
MRLFAFLLLAVGLPGCSLFSEDSSLLLRDLQLEVTPVWAVQTGELPENANVQLTPFIAGDRLYVANVAGGVTAMNERDASPLWTVDLDEQLTGGPAADDRLVLLGTIEAELIALDAKDGKTLWRSRICSEMLAVPVLTADKILLQCIDGYVVALNRDDGQRIWSYRRIPPTLTLRGTASPLVEGERVIAGFADGVLVSLGLEKGELQWEATIAVPRGRNDLERMVDIDGRFRVADGVIYVSSYQGRVAAVSLENGRFLWTRDMSSYTGVELGDSQLLLSDDQGRVWALDLRTGATLWRQDKFASRLLSAPAIMGPTVVVADDQGNIHWLDSRDGHVLATENITKAWDYFHYRWEDEEGDQDKPDHAITTYPVVTNEHLFVRDNTGALVAFRSHAITDATTSSTP